MSANYFHDLVATTATRVWINNPTAAETALAQAQGAVGCTTNPAFAANRLKRDPASVHPLIDACLAHSADDRVVAAQVQEQLVAQLCRDWQPRFAASGGKEGWVSIQGDPYRDHDPESIVSEAMSARRLAANVIAKIPATTAGFAAVERLVAADVPCLVTEVYTLTQARRAAEAYRRASAASGRTPAYFVTHITGIYEECLGRTAAAAGIAIDPADLAQAGLICARRQYQVMRRERHPGMLMGGGLRAAHHFTGLVGGNLHVTMNWVDFEGRLAASAGVEPRIDTPEDPQVVARLRALLPDFRAAYDDDGLPPERFDDYRPVTYFRDMFVAGWDQLCAAIRARRAHAAKG